MPTPYAKAAILQLWRTWPANTCPALHLCVWFLFVAEEHSSVRTIMPTVGHLVVSSSELLGESYHERPALLWTCFHLSW